MLVLELAHPRDEAVDVVAADAVHTALAALARDSRERAGDEPLRAAYLVGHDDVEGFVARVRELQDEHPELAILCTGPWPPYSFAEDPA